MTKSEATETWTVCKVKVIRFSCTPPTPYPTRSAGEPGASSLCCEVSRVSLFRQESPGIALAPFWLKKNDCSHNHSSNTVGL
ncbi:hypothetical protein BALCAV_0200460 [Alkalihalobacillus alcalophilus ATCC 27647 = CGMCC 1.3604]|uniref:Uncharacterized protein n=1 Tax=Alkalihalobacillus alcalophilus ATCC 27647 = CGMCC 1.3604 TaxID=1218173 RepID=A0A094Z014_ALKAL|nr:hypothetical protein BALCAV_0200460 [Alkalihalobacillus alcalophilus ATCC 27647 = CGMCC 1.3604]